MAKMISKVREKLVAELLQSIEEDPHRDGLKETPKRVSKMYEEIFSGYKLDPKEVFKVFKSNGYKGLVTVGNNFYSVCEHHMLPFYGKIYIRVYP